MKRSLFLLLLLVFIALTPAPVRADVAPPPVPGIGGLQALDYQKTEVEMRYERVEMELQQLPTDEYGPKDLVQVMVDAWFIMHNTGSQAEQMQVVFPLGDFTHCLPDHAGTGGVSYSSFYADPKSFSAWVDGSIVPVSRIKTPKPDNRQGACPSAEMDWAAFDVKFPPNRDVVIRVSYRLLPTGGDDVQNVGYVLETGAGWKGSVGGGVIVFRFPYQVGENLIEGTTPGYRTLENEIYWTFNNLEPTSENNIRVNFVPPFTRNKIQDSLDRIHQNPQDIPAWVQLAETYYDISYIKSWPIDEAYDKKVWQTYEQAMQANPNSAEIAASYAARLDWTCCLYEAPSEPSFEKIMRLVDIVMRYDPHNQEVGYILDGFKASIPNFTYNPPAVISTFTPTPGPTEPPTGTSLPTTERPPETPEPSGPQAAAHAPITTPTATPSPTSSPASTEAPAATLTAVPTVVEAAASSRPVFWLWPAAGSLIIILILLGLWSLRGKTWN